MATEQNNPLANLNLSGLNKLEQNAAARGTRTISKKALKESDGLGVLSSLSGTWAGHGFNLIEVPNMNLAKSGAPSDDSFRLILNSTAETITFSDIQGKIINRGNAQEDIAYLSMHYLQQVSDVNLPKDENGIHLETGLFLNLPDGTNPLVQPTIARLGSIPHGDSLLAQGTFLTVNGPPEFEIADPTPFVLVNGERKNLGGDKYLSLLTNAVPPPGIPKEAIMNPNLLLENDIKDQDIIETIVIFLDANPIPGVANREAVAPTGGITNIPFITVNANATSFTAIFWIETVRNPDGTTFLQLQYTQTVILDFPVMGPSGVPINIGWPHISVATMRLQS